MNAAEKQLRRLVAIDTALASADGLCVASVASQWQMNPKTVRRTIDGIKAMGLSVVTVRIGAPGDFGSRYVQRYANRRKRLFPARVINNPSASG